MSRSAWLGGGAPVAFQPRRSLAIAVRIVVLGHVDTGDRHTKPKPRSRRVLWLVGLGCVGLLVVVSSQLSLGPSGPTDWAGVPDGANVRSSATMQELVHVIFDTTGSALEAWAADEGLRLTQDTRTRSTDDVETNGAYYTGSSSGCARLVRVVVVDRFSDTVFAESWTGCQGSGRAAVEEIRRTRDRPAESSRR